ncbi:ABC transporter permease [Lactovum odontotermitis]
MNVRQIKTLFEINLRYANPQITTQNRKRGKAGKRLTNSLLIQYALSGLVFLVIFTLMMLTIDFPKYQGYFGLYCLLYIIFAASQSFASLHNVMYESRDLKDFLPLPVANTSIFFAKFLTVAFTVLSYALPLLTLFLITGFRATGIIGILLAIPIFLIIFLLIMAVSVWLISLLVQTKVFQRYKKTANLILLVLPTVGSLGAYFYLVFQNNSRTEAAFAGKLIDRPVLPVFTPIFDALVRPISLGSLLFWLLSLLVLALLYLVIQKRTIPGMFEMQLAEGPARNKKKTKNKKRVHKSSTSLSHQLFRYNLGLVKSPTLWRQALLNGYVMPFAFVFGMSMGGLDLSQISIRFFATFFLAGGSFSLLTTNVASLCGLIISLDRENYSYIKALPWSLETYLRAKFHFAVGLQILMNTVALALLSLIMQIPIIMLVPMLLGNWLTQYVCSQYYYYRDFRLLSSTWTNLSELYTRGSGNWLTVGVLIGSILGGAIAVGVSAFLQMLLPLPLLVNMVLISITIAILFVVYRHYLKAFWRSAQIH